MSVSDKGLANLKGLTNLEELDLNDDKAINGPGLKYLSDLKNLRQLNLNGDPVDDESLESIGNLTNLESLILYDAPITDLGLVICAVLHTCSPWL